MKKTYCQKILNYQIEEYKQAIRTAKDEETRAIFWKGLQVLYREKRFINRHYEDLTNDMLSGYVWPSNKEKKFDRKNDPVYK